VPVRVRLDSADADFGALRPGLSVMAKVNTDEAFEDQASALKAQL